MSDIPFVPLEESEEEYAAFWCYVVDVAGDTRSYAFVLSPQRFPYWIDVEELGSSGVSTESMVYCREFWDQWLVAEGLTQLPFGLEISEIVL